MPQNLAVPSPVDLPTQSRLEIVSAHHRSDLLRAVGLPIATARPSDGFSKFLPVLRCRLLRTPCPGPPQLRESVAVAQERRHSSLPRLKSDEEFLYGQQRLPLPSSEPPR